MNRNVLMNTSGHNSLSNSNGGTNGGNSMNYQQQQFHQLKDLSLHVGGALTALNLSHDKRQVAVVGREVLKIVSISEEEGLKESQNLRVGKVNLNYSSVDVRWHPSEQHRHLIATAATNGAVVIWNNHNVGSQKQERIINDHTRTVNRISWHPEHPWTLLSGSQDGTMKLWDIRDPSNCKVTFDGKSESVRDVRFSTHYANFFAAAFDNGTIQIWDIRKHSSYETSITAHQGPVFCIDWHPEDKSMIATGGRDRFIQVWDLNGTKGKPIYTIQTVSSVSHVAWRPGHKYHIASSALVESKIHVWNVKKPFIPNLSFIGHHDVVTDVNWLNADKILSCGKDSTLQLQNAKYAYRPYQHIRSTGMTWTPTGQLAFVNEKINRSNTLLAEESMDQKNRKVVFTKNGVKKSARNNENEVLDSGEGSSISVFLAERYKFEEKELPFPELCQHNSDVAKEAKQFQIAQSWILLKLFFENNDQTNSSIPSPPPPKDPTLPRQHTNKPSLSPPLRMEPELTGDNSQIGNVQDSLFNLFESEPGFLMNGNSFLDGNHPYIAGDFHMDGTDFLPSDVNFPLAPLPFRNPLQFDDPAAQSNAFDMSPSMVINNIPKEKRRDRKKLLLTTSGQFKTFGTLFGSDLPFDPKPAVLDMLQHYAEIGDIQTAVVMSLVLGDRVPIPAEKLKQWSLSYIDCNCGLFRTKSLRNRKIYQ
eukprot:TRINITY_DN4905_c0_g1_i1.p1 TRINITY_DN4905_c0_g1~~TRINITY_DN4905_c0_g1_i1.p1  ORF type:complete len:702 (-),score=266.85 TRINITY_DN4905_c0_g1_i1:430-2535(-)